MKRLLPLALLLLSGCQGIGPAGPAVADSGPDLGVSVRYVELEKRWATFQVQNGSSESWSYLGHGPEGSLVVTYVQHLEEGSWETCLTALGCASDLATYTLAPGDTIRLRVLLDEALPTRLGLPLWDGANTRVAWSDPLDPRSLGLYGGEAR